MPAMLVDMNVGMRDPFLINRNLPVYHIADMVGGLHQEVDVMSKNKIRP